MARMNKRNAKPRNTATTPIATTGQAFTVEGGKGWQRTPKGELFLAAVTSLNEDTFYESADERATVSRPSPRTTRSSPIPSGRSAWCAGSARRSDSGRSPQLSLSAPSRRA